MRKYNLPLLLLAIAISAWIACTKEKNSPDPLLTKTWKRALTDQNPSTNPKGNVIYQAVIDCQKDDMFSFNGDGTLKIDNGTEKCEATEAKIESGTYHIGNQEIVIKGIKYTLAEVAANQVKYYATIPAGTGYTYVVFLLQ